MEHFSFRHCPRHLLILSLVLVGGVSCKNNKAVPAEAPPVVAPALLGNQMAAYDGPVYLSQAKSPIHWQPWSKDTLGAARQAKRLVLAVVVMPQQPDFRKVLSELERDGGSLKAIRDNYVPVIIDGDTVREMGLLSEILCSEIKQPLEMPLFIWMTYEGNPVAWIPVPRRNAGDSIRVFNQSHEMVSRMWREDPGYVLRNSSLDNNSRRERMKAVAAAAKAAEDPAAAGVNATRQLVSLYDPVSRSIDETGGLFPSGPLDLAVAASLMPGIPENLKERSTSISEELLKDLLPSAMFDPLEGGVFSGRAGPSWSLPSFGWNCPDQARIAAILFRAYQLDGDPVTLDRAVGLVRFAEKKFAGPEGLFAFGAAGDSSPEEWMWSVPDITKLLPAEDAKWWIAATGMKELGNLPSEIDSGRKYFRSNTLSLYQPLEQTAAALSVPPAVFSERFAASKAKLLEARSARQGQASSDPTANAVANFRMVSAYAAAYAATGDSAYRDKAAALLGRARMAFSTEDGLKACTGNGGAATSAARAFVYALAIQAAQDLADVSLDETPLAWAAELADTAGRLFLQDGELREAPADALVLDLPIVDQRRVFDDTSGGLFALCAARAGGRVELKSSLEKLARPLSDEAARNPVLHTDGVLAVLVKHHSKSILLGPNLNPEMKEAVSRLPLPVFPRSTAKVSDGIPPGSVRVLSADGSGKLISNPADLLKELPLREKKP